MINSRSLRSVQSGIALLAVFVFVAVSPGYSSYAAEAADRVFLCRKTEESIRIDGKADEKVWATAEEISPFLMPWADPPANTGTLTSARLLWDDKYLYFFANMEDGDLQAKIREKDGEIWTEDVFELFFMPDPGKSGYYEFEINALGTVLDMFIPERTGDLYVKHKSDRKFSLAAKVIVDGTLNRADDADKGWQVEGRIPWTDFAPTGGKPDQDDEWRFNLCRYDYGRHLTKSPELSVSGPNMPRSFHAHESYSPLRFAGPRDPREDLPKHVQKISGFDGSTIVGTPDPPLPFTVEPVGAGPRINQLITFTFEPESGRMIYVEQLPGVKNSRLMCYDPKTGDEQLLMEPPEVIYDVAFHPDYLENGQIFLSYNGPAEADRFDKRVQILRFVRDRDSGAPIDPDSGEVIMEWPCRGHTGGALAFDDDGLFYITSGDGTSDSDNNLTGQNTLVLHAKVLRIDVDTPGNGRPYSVPDDNPFIGRDDVLPETFAYGLRNPWRSEWDSRLQRLWVGNNGQDRLEQVYLIAAGANYGWSVYEGSRIFYGDRERGPDPISGPTTEHDHGESRSLTGGIVYTGDDARYADLKNAYLYADYSTGRIWAVLHDGDKVLRNWEIADTSLKITEFGVDPVTGDILVASHEPVPAGGLYRLIANPAKSTIEDFPRKLSQTGLFESVQEHRVSEQLLPFDVVVPEWLDGAEAERYLALPEGNANVTYASRRGWAMPDGTVAVQSIARGTGGERRRIETRVLTKQQNEWAAYSYLWNEAQTDAELVDASGAEVELANGGKWAVPSRSECMVCHSRAANFVLGLQASQMNRDFDYGGGYVANQLQVMDDLGFFLRPGAAKRTSLLRKSPGEEPRLVDPFAADADVDATTRARSYLHATCSHCHVQSGGGNAKMDLRDFVNDELFNVIGVDPNHGDQGLGAEAKLVVPGDPAKSILLNRCIKVGPGHMPPIGSSGPDARAVGLLMQWIAEAKVPDNPEPEVEDKPGTTAEKGSKE